MGLMRSAGRRTVRRRLRRTGASAPHPAGSRECRPASGPAYSGKTPPAIRVLRAPRPAGKRDDRAASGPTDGDSEKTPPAIRVRRAPRPADSRVNRAARRPTNGEMTAPANRVRQPPPGRQSQRPTRPDRPESLRRRRPATRRRTPENRHWRESVHPTRVRVHRPEPSCIRPPRWCAAGWHRADRDRGRHPVPEVTVDVDGVVVDLEPSRWRRCA